MSDPVVVILAGGLGTRLRHLHPGVPKPMIPVAGRPFIDYVVGFFVSQGLGRILLSTGHLSEALESHFARNPVPGADVRCVREPAAAGTAGGFLHAARSVETPPEGWIVANGDSLALAPLAPFLDSFAAGGWDAGIVAIPEQDTGRYGSLEVDPAGALRHFAEKRPGRGPINAGIYFFPQRTLARFPESLPLSFELQVFPELLRQRARVRVHPTAAPFLDMGTPDALASADGFVRRHASACGLPAGAV